jgi:tetratricopeptide (TPR) repeat protein
LFESKKEGWVDGLFASHPPSRERVQNNRAQVDALMPSLAGRDLDMGERRYLQATAQLMKDKPAYKQFDEAEKAVAKKDYASALVKVDAAIKQVPQEARFHGLKGDILVYQKRYQDAIGSYDEAIKHDDNYYDYYLGRGVAHSRLNQTALARQDLQRSNKLLPTAAAANELGKLALNDGNRAEAKRLFQQASVAKGLVGEEAGTAFAQLDVQDNPARYLQAQAFADRSGRVLAQVANRSPVEMHNVLVQISALINGKVVQRNVAVRSLAPNAVETIGSGLAFPEGSVWNADMMKAQVVGAGR